MNVQLRRAEPADAAAIATVHIQTWQAAYRGQLPDHYLDHLGSEVNQRAEMWRSNILNPRPKTEIWVANNNGQLEGFVALGPARDANATTGEVYAIYVHPNHWDQGVGRTLFTHAASRLVSLEFSAAFLWVLESNARARRFYELAGWNFDGRTKLETRPNGIELKEVSYRKEFRRDREE